MRIANPSFRALSALPVRAALLTLSLAACTAAAAHEYFLPGFTLIHPWAEATEAGATSAPVYFTVENVSAADRLLRVVTPLAERVEIREAAASRPALKSLPIGPGTPTSFTPGHAHLVLQGLRQPLEWGRSYGMTLMFEKAGPVQVMLSVGAH